MEDLRFTKESYTNYSYFEAPGDTGNKYSKRIAVPANFVTYLTHFQSDLYCINDLNCYYDSKHVFQPNYTGRFSMNFTRRGYFTFETYKRFDEEYASRIMLEKAGCEFEFIQQQPGYGGCTVFSFTDKGYHLLNELYPLEKLPFFSNANAFSIVFSANAGADLLHYRILQRLLEGNAVHLEIDCLAAELTETVMHLLLSQSPAKALSASMKRNHLRTIERAKEYMLHHFSQDITLHDLAAYCYTSHFHFTRLFKQCCGCSPFTYLQQIRLKHAEILIRTTELPVTDICLTSGFNRLDYFSATFNKQYGFSPVKYRLKQAPKSFATKLSLQCQFQQWQFKATC